MARIPKWMSPQPRSLQHERMVLLCRFVSSLYERCKRRKQDTDRETAARKVDTTQSLKLAALQVSCSSSPLFARPTEALRKYGLPQSKKGSLEHLVRQIKNGGLNAEAFLAHASQQVPLSSPPFLVSGDQDSTIPTGSPATIRRSAIKMGRNMLLGGDSGMSGSARTGGKKGEGGRAIARKLSGQFGVSVSRSAIVRACANPDQSPKRPGRPRLLSKETEAVIIDKQPLHSPKSRAL